MSLDVIRCGFVPLTDCATLVVAAEMGFAAGEGIALELLRETGWSSIRDKVALGVYPVAHMLSPLAIAMSLGLGPVPVTVDAPFVLNLNGNTLSFRPDLAAELRGLGAAFGDPVATGRALVARAKAKPIRLGVPFPQSMHRELMRCLIAGSGGDPDRDIAFAVAPPPLLGAVLGAGEVDGVMVGEPWGSVAADAGLAEILLPGAAIWQAAPEKVLAMRRDWHEDNRDLALRLIRALHRASLWAADPASLPALGEILAAPRYVNAPAELIEQALRGMFVLDRRGGIGSHPGALRLGGVAATFPWRSAALWIAAAVARDWGVRLDAVRAAASGCFRSDLYRQALLPLGVNLPAASMKLEGAMAAQRSLIAGSGEIEIGPDSFFNGAVFNPDA